jgi:hypothetical protein
VETRQTTRCRCVGFIPLLRPSPLILPVPDANILVHLQQLPSAPVVLTLTEVNIFRLHDSSGKMVGCWSRVHVQNNLFVDPGVINCFALGTSVVVHDTVLLFNPKNRPTFVDAKTAREITLGVAVPASECLVNVRY